MAEQVDPEELERARLLYGALGLLDPAEDLEAVFSDVLGEQVIGYYDPEAQRLVIRDDVIGGLAASSGPETEDARLVLVHELVHALQDQRLGLSESYDVERTADADNAFRAVVEGDAMLAMLGNTLRAQGIPLSAATRGDRTARKLHRPGHVRTGGEARRRARDPSRDAGGLPTCAAFSSLRRCTRSAVGRRSIAPIVGRPRPAEQVLHPDKFIQGEPGRDVRGG